MWRSHSDINPDGFATCPVDTETLFGGFNYVNGLPQKMENR